ncbi:hypothetical protein [Bradyrhizobium sp. ERR14]|uniref:hypothetical protein n=1 Tax=Bradyrhizobium sp. ERR14 TaxID=2663837 RepID=UPI001612AF72|nr:hypothetical protein [Bradyrhizobium sp. ERR14]MBB4394049.1 hypothetical protein [Bradyrhizobium sp. ERR14]
MTKGYCRFQSAQAVRQPEAFPLGLKSVGAKRKPDLAVKYLGPNGESWRGFGAMTSWLKKPQKAGEDIERCRAPAPMLRGYSPSRRIACARVFDARGTSMDDVD